MQIMMDGEVWPGQGVTSQSPCSRSHGAAYGQRDSDSAGAEFRVNACRTDSEPGRRGSGGPSRTRDLRRSGLPRQRQSKPVSWLSELNRDCRRSGFSGGCTGSAATQPSSSYSDQSPANLARQLVSSGDSPVTQTVSLSSGRRNLIPSVT